MCDARAEDVYKGYREWPDARDNRVRLSHDESISKGYKGSDGQPFSIPNVYKRLKIVFA